MQALNQLKMALIKLFILLIKQNILYAIKVPCCCYY